MLNSINSHSFFYLHYPFLIFIVCPPSFNFRFSAASWSLNRSIALLISFLIALYYLNLFILYLYKSNLAKLNGMQHVTIGIISSYGILSSISLSNIYFTILLRLSPLVFSLITDTSMASLNFIFHALYISLVW